MPSPQVSRPAFATPRRLATAALMLVGSCLSGDGRGPTGVRPSDADPAFEISDAVHSAGTAGFYFLPPMVGQPTVSGVFDATIETVNPRVVICDVTEGPAQDCGGSTPALREPFYEAYTQRRALPASLERKLILYEAVRQLTA